MKKFILPSLIALSLFAGTQSAQAVLVGDHDGFQELVEDFKAARAIYDRDRQNYTPAVGAAYDHAKDEEFQLPLIKMVTEALEDGSLAVDDFLEIMMTVYQVVADFSYYHLHNGLYVQNSTPQTTMHDLMLRLHTAEEGKEIPVLINVISQLSNDQLDAFVAAMN